MDSFIPIKINLQTLMKHPLHADEAKYLINIISDHFPDLSQPYYSSNNWYTFKRDKGINYETAITKLDASLFHLKAYLHPTFDILKSNQDTERIQAVTKELDDMPKQSAISFIKTLNQIGYRIPEYISIIGFYNIREGSVITPELITI
ncbi:Uncharacterised protein [Aerococcus viridans]|uniref:Uncharacterized protein n=2 Tax=Aerococcus viridans TaxID=1377 RepID=A0AAU8UJV9_9LACT|nr:hypothetical protein [Aerococcus viridans]AMC00566.1 hypothetical protein AWM76_02815 [Aerococcus viridans]SPT61386.1 Uncharacterised protein [Aerococcus viridans]SUU07639.1 Uncharacterised protein [Aerococcus viridans]